MKTHTIHGKVAKTVEIDAPGETWHVAREGRIISEGNGYHGDQVDHSTIIVDGRIKAQYMAVEIYSGDDTKVRVGRDASISTGSAGFSIWGERVQASNAGTVESSQGFIFVGDDASLVNSAGGVIRAVTYGVSFSSEPGSHSKLINHGLIVGGDRGAAVVDFRSDNSVINDGRIVGDIRLGDGQDFIDTRGGTIRGPLFGGAGDDTLITDDADITLTELFGEGADTVKSTVSYTLTTNVENLFLLGHKNLKGFGDDGNNQLHGNDADNILRGRDGNDKLFGGAGNDQLFGGADGDFFQFATGWDRDRIQDFEQGLDLIDTSRWKGIDDFTEVLQHAHDGKLGVVITLGHDSLTIEGASRAELVGGDFMF